MQSLYEVVLNPAGLSASVPQRVAFFVGLSANMGPVNEHTDIVFDRVVTNVGAAYNEENGHFTAPVNGTYQFNVVISAQGRQKVEYYSRLNRDPCSCVGLYIHIVSMRVPI